jgi:MipA family protein
MPRLTATAGFIASGLLASGTAFAAIETDPATEVLTTPASSGLGFIMRLAPSPYRDAGTKGDLSPLYLYEGDRVFLRSTRAGIKVVNRGANQFDVFVDKRVEGHPLKSRPASLAGMDVRTNATDAGVAWRFNTGQGELEAQYLRDVSSGHHGSEVRLGYGVDWQSGRLTLRPAVTLAWRDARLNDYYFGVRPSEATAARPAYSAGAGINTTLGLDATYALSRGWRVLGGVSATLLGSQITNSPVVSKRVLPSLYVGAAYDFGAPQKAPAGESTPVYVKALYGKSTEDGCHLAKILTARCFATASTNRTNIEGVQIGKPFAQTVGGWPFDLVGYVGLTRHDERGLQQNGLQADLFMKAYFHGFPWNHVVKTRAGLGAGLSLAQRPPYIETKTQDDRKEPASRLLNYLDPTLDVSVGDIIGVRSLKDTYVGVGVSHRSGIFGSSRLLNNVKGGSNYIYSYVETAF